MRLTQSRNLTGNAVILRISYYVSFCLSGLGTKMYWSEIGNLFSCGPLPSHLPFYPHCRSLLPEKRCLAAEASPVTCTLTWPPFMNVLGESRAGMAPSPRSPFSQCPMTVRIAVLQQKLFNIIYGQTHQDVGSCLLIENVRQYGGPHPHLQLLHISLFWESFLQGSGGVCLRTSLTIQFFGWWSQSFSLESRCHVCCSFWELNQWSVIAPKKTKNGKH